MDFNFKNIILLLARRKKTIFIITAVAIGLGVLVSSPFIMPPKYKSFAVLYPSNIQPYGQESQAEQALQMLESDNIKDEVIKAFDLGTHYKVDKNSKTYHTEVLNIYDDNVSVNKTLYESVEITAYDEDPQVAYNIVKKIVDTYNDRIRTLQRAKIAETVEIHRSFTEKKKRELDSLTARYQEIKNKYGILDVGLQSEAAIKAYYKIIGKGGKPSTELSSTLENLRKFGEEFVLIGHQITTTRSIYIDSKNNYDHAIKDLKKFLTYSNLVTEPYPADKKSSPIRWLIVMMFTLSGLGFSVLLTIFTEYNPIRRILKSEE